MYERFQVDIYNFYLNYFNIHLSMFSQHQLLTVILLKFLLLTMLIELFRTKGSPTINIATTILGVLVISLCFGTLISLRELFPYGFPVYKFFATGFADDQQLAQINRWGGYTVIAVFASIWMCDTAAYFGGLAFGKHRLFERVSPKKTWEGAVFGFIFSVLTMVAAKILVLGLSYISACNCSWECSLEYSDNLAISSNPVLSGMRESKILRHLFRDMVACTIGSTVWFISLRLCIFI